MEKLLNSLMELQYVIMLTAVLFDCLWESISGMACIKSFWIS